MRWDMRGIFKPSCAEWNAEAQIQFQASGEGLGIAILHSSARTGR